MSYTKEKAELPEGFIDLGEEVSAMGMTEIEIETPKNEYHYPSLYFDNAEELSKLPKEGTAVIHFKKVMEKKETMMRDGKETKRHCCELQINGIKSNGSSDDEMDDEEAIDSGLEEAESTKPTTKIEIEIGGEEEED
jgi:hypothetical protein